MNRSLEHKRSIGDRYASSSYYVSIRQTCDRAFPPSLGPSEGKTNAVWTARLTSKQMEEPRAWRKAHRRHPYQLRHNVATEIRRAFGLYAAQLVLGH